MSEWRETTIQNLIDKGFIEAPKDDNHGNIHPKSSDYVSDGIPFIMANDLVGGRVDYQNCVFVSEEQAKTLKKGFSVPNDVLLTHKATLGRTAIVDSTFPTIVLTPQVTYYRVIKGIDNRYLKYYFDTEHFQSTLANWGASGSTRAYLGITAQCKLPVILPPLPEQKAIADTLSILDRNIELNNQANKVLEEMAQAIFKSWFVDFEPFGGEMPEDWEGISFNDLITISKKSFNPLKSEEIMLEHYSIPAFDSGKLPVFQLSTEIKSNKYVVDSDSFMISKLNPTTKRVWKPYCIQENFVCSSEFIVYKAKKEEYKYLAYGIIDSEEFSEFMCSHVTGSTGSRQRTTPSETLNFPCVLPDVDTLNEFSDILTPIYEIVRTNQIEIMYLTEIRNTLLPKLMSGEVRVPLEEV